MKKKRPKSNRLTEPQQLPSRRPLHITVGTALEPERGVDIEHDLRLLKTALLYADKVKLCSLGSSMILSLAQYKKLSREERIEVVSMLWQNLVDASEDDQVRQLVELIPVLSQLQRTRKLKEELKQSVPRDQFLIIHKLDKVFRNLVDGMNSALDAGIDNVTGGVRLDELESALSSGLIELQPIDPGSTHVVEDYFDVIADAIKSDHSYPLLDSSTGNLVSLAIKEGKLEIPDISIARAKGVGLSADLLSRLPLFDIASVDEVVSIRRELESPLIRFRSAMLEFSDEIRSAAWEKAFPLECEMIFMKRVAPSILEIEEAVRSNKRLRVFTETFIQEKGLLAISSLGLVLASANNLTATVSQFLPPAAAGTVILGKSELTHQKRRGEIEQNQLYFYYKAGELLRRQKR